MVKATINREHYQTLVLHDGLELIADEPVVKGGQHTGFAPSALLKSALAACTAITLRMYADRKGWPLDKVDVDVDFAWQAEEKKTVMTKRITLFGPLDEDQKKRILQIADLCPVNKILSNPIEMIAD